VPEEVGMTKLNLLGAQPDNATSPRAAAAWHTLNRQLLGRLLSPDAAHELYERVKRCEESFQKYERAARSVPSPEQRAELERLQKDLEKAVDDAERA
jgi:hypothetical protein